MVNCGLGPAGAKPMQQRADGFEAGRGTESHVFGPFSPTEVKNRSPRVLEPATPETYGTASQGRNETPILLFYRLCVTLHSFASLEVLTIVYYLISITSQPDIGFFLVYWMWLAHEHPVCYAIKSIPTPPPTSYYGPTCHAVPLFRSEVPPKM